MVFPESVVLVNQLRVARWWSAARSTMDAAQCSTAERASSPRGAEGESVLLSRWWVLRRGVAALSPQAGHAPSYPSERSHSPAHNRPFVGGPSEAPNHSHQPPLQLAELAPELWSRVGQGPRLMRSLAVSCGALLGGVHASCAVPQGLRRCRRDQKDSRRRSAQPAQARFV